jgi:hypothetical protein
MDSRLGDWMFALAIAAFIFTTVGLIVFSIYDGNRTDVKVAEIGAEVCQSADDPGECLVTISTNR